MSDAPAWAAVGVSGVALAFSGYAVVRGELRARAEARRSSALARQRAALGPAHDELRSSLVEVRALFADVVAQGGVDSDWFDESRKWSAKLLRDHALRVGDAHLRSAVDGAAKAWDETFAHAPPPLGPRVFNLGGAYPEEYRREDLARDQRHAAQAEKARTGERFCDEALDRLNALERPRE